MGFRPALISACVAAILVALATVMSPSAHAAGAGATAGDPAGAVNGGTSPSDWFNGAKQSNWEPTDKISAGMAQILSQALIDFGSYQPSGPCPSAAANQAWQALADAANGGYVEAFIDAIKSALSGIKKVATFGADPSEAADLVNAGALADKAFEQAKDKGSDWLKEKLKEIYKGKPPEVLKRESHRGGCDVVLVAIWDHEAQTYEITIYGDCHCQLVRTWNGSQSVKLKTFAVQLKGRVVPDIQDGERVLHVGFPKITVAANCNCGAGGVTVRPPTGGGASGVTPGGGTATVPNTPEGWRKVKTNCKPCQPIVDAIQAAQDAREGMTAEFRDAMAQLDAAKSRGDKSDIAAAQAAVDALTSRENGLIKLQQELFTKLKACEKEKCPEPGTTTSGTQPGTPSAPPTPASGQPMDKNSNLQPAQPAPGQKAGSSSGVSLPPWAGAGSQIVINVNPDDAPEGGAIGVVLITEDQTGHKQLLQGKGSAGRIAIVAALSTGVLRAIELVTGFDEKGHEIVGSTCQIGEPPHIEGTDALANVPPDKLAIREASASVQPGDNMVLHIQRNDPLTTRFSLDGQPVKTLGVSNNSAVVQFDKETTLAHHQLVMSSGNNQTQPLTIAFVRLTPHPIGVSHPGVTQTVTIEVAGLVPSDNATMYFQLDGDAAAMAAGGNTATVPVQNGKAEVQVIGKHAGQIILHFRLDVKNPQFASAH